MTKTRDHAKVRAAAERCLAELAGLSDCLTTAQVAASLGFAEGLLDELIAACELGEDAPMVGPVARMAFEATAG